MIKASADIKNSSCIRGYVRCSRHKIPPQMRLQSHSSKKKNEEIDRYKVEIINSKKGGERVGCKNLKDRRIIADWRVLERFLREN